MKRTKVLFFLILVCIILFVSFVGIKVYQLSSGIVLHSLPISSPPFYGYKILNFTDAQHASLPYYLYIPANYQPQKHYPLVLVLHGGGERSQPGNTPAQNLQILLDHQYVQVWSASYSAADNPDIQQHWPAFVVVPQLAQGQQWVNTPSNQGSYAQATTADPKIVLAKELLDALQRQYQAIDAHRLYITGLSLGGYGTWDAIERWPDYFAAAAPIAGGGDPSRASVLKNMPIWAFHGSNDHVVPVSGSRAMIAAIKADGGEPRYTELAGQGHGVWANAYSQAGASPLVSGFFPWLFAQKR